MIIALNSKKDITDIEALRNRSQFKVVFDRYATSLYLSASKHLGKDDAKDIVQELMIETWNKREDIRGNAEGSIKNYLFIRLKFKIIDFFSQKPNHILWEEALPELMQISINEEHNLTLINELNKIISDSLNEMTPSELEVFKLRWEKQLSVEDTSKALSISSKSVMNRFSTAMKTVRKNVTAYYNEESVAGYQITILELIVLKIIIP